MATWTIERGDIATTYTITINHASYMIVGSADLMSYVIQIKER